jgi:sulfur transfer protein SufE
MANTISWEYKDFWGFWLIDDEYLVPDWYANNIESWAEVEAEEFENIQWCYKVVWLVNQTKNNIENIIEWRFRKTKNWFIW